MQLIYTYASLLAEWMVGLDQVMTVFERFQSVVDVLTPNEKRLVRTIVESPTDAALGTAGDLAKSVGVHEATASRLAKKLGYDSYAAFRGAMRNEFIATRDTATRFEKTMSTTEDVSILGEIARQEAQALERIEDFIKPDQIDRVARKLMSAKRLFLYGYGNAETLALMMQKRFRRFGADVHKLEANPRGLAEQVLGFGPGDVVLTFVFRRTPHGYAPLVESAREAGAETIVIADSAGATLLPQPDCLLSAPRSGDPDSFQTLTVPMTICNALVIAAGHTQKEQSLKQLERLGQLIERFE